MVRLGKMLNEVNNEIWCKLAPSKIQGIGVFAIRDIPRGTKLSNYKKYCLTEEEFDKLLPEVRNEILDKICFEDDLCFNTAYANFQAYMNHSDNPNSDGVYALQDIKKDEEITENYRHLNKTIHPLSAKHFKFLNENRNS